MNNIYADRDIMGLDEIGGHYIRHVDRMTAEGLHSKSDIAAELGFRDMRIEALENAIKDHADSFCGDPEPDDLTLWAVVENPG